MHEFVKSPYSHEFTSGCMRAWQTSADKLILWDNFYIQWYIISWLYYIYDIWLYFLVLTSIFKWFDHYING